MSYCPPLVLFLLGAALAWGLERAPRKAEHRQVDPTHKHPRATESINKQQRNTEEEPDSALQREYWEPCNSSFREYYSWGCTGG